MSRVLVYESEGEYPWCVTGDLRATEDEHNDDYQAKVEHLAQIRRNLEAPLGDVIFDSEHACFFAYCKRREDAETIAHFAEGVAGVRPPTIRLPKDVGYWVKLDDYQDAVPVGSVGVIINAFRDPELHADDEDRNDPGYEDDRPDVWEIYVPALQPEVRLSTNNSGGTTVRVPAGSQTILEVERDG